MSVGTSERATIEVLEKATGEPIEFTARRRLSLQRAPVEYPY